MRLRRDAGRRSKLFSIIKAQNKTFLVPPAMKKGYKKRTEKDFDAPPQGEARGQRKKLFLFFLLTLLPELF